MTHLQQILTLLQEGVFTLEGEYKYFNLEDISTTTQVNGGDVSGTCFCMFEGDSYTGTALYLFPQMGPDRPLPALRALHQHRPPE